MSKRKILIAVFSVILIFVFSVCIFFRAKYVVPILMYHSVNPKSNPAISRLIVSPQTFEKQMQFLKSRHYNVVPLESLVVLIKEKKKIPPKTAAITFDDGYKDNYTYAFPILKKYALPAMVFIIVNEVGRSDRLSWQEIKEMQDSGLIAIGSHTMGPDPLFKMKSEAELKAQIFDSKRVLEEKLGRKINIFSYPEGAFNSKIRQLVIDAGYFGAVATTPGKDYPNDDTFALKRLRISENAKNMFIFAVEASGYYTFMKEYNKKAKNAKK